jgi:hypothetical protein
MKFVSNTITNPQGWLFQFVFTEDPQRGVVANVEVPLNWGDDAEIAVLRLRDAADTIEKFLYARNQQVEAAKRAAALKMRTELEAAAKAASEAEQLASDELRARKQVADKRTEILLSTLNALPAQTDEAPNAS